MNVCVLDMTHPRRRALICQQLQLISPDIEIAAIVRDAGSALEKVEFMHIDLLVADYLAYLVDSRFAQFVLEKAPKTKILWIHDYPAEEDIVPSINTCGFLLTHDLLNSVLGEVIFSQFPSLKEAPEKEAYKSDMINSEDISSASLPLWSTGYSLLMLYMPENYRRCAELLSEAANREYRRENYLIILDHDSESASLLTIHTSRDSQSVNSIVDRILKISGQSLCRFFYFETITNKQSLLHIFKNSTSIIQESFFISKKLIALELPLKKPQPISASAIGNITSRLHEFLYTNNKLGFFSSLKKLYLDILTNSLHLPSVMFCHEKVKLLWHEFFIDSACRRTDIMFPEIASCSNIEVLYSRTAQAFSSLLETMSAEYSDGVQQAVQYIFANYQNSFSTADIAVAVGLSMSALSSRFKHEVGFTMVDYINHIRIYTSKILLSTNRNIKIDDVASQCGFNNPKYFSRIFREKTGMTPSQYRDSAFASFPDIRNFDVETP